MMIMTEWLDDDNDLMMIMTDDKMTGWWYWQNNKMTGWWHCQNVKYINGLWIYLCVVTWKVGTPSQLTNMKS